MRTTLIAVILLLLIAATPYPPTAYAVKAVDLGDDTDEVYEEIKAAAEARRDELLYLLELELPPDILETLMEALYAMDEAEETTDPREATEQYLYALKQFRKTWQRYLSYSPEAATESLGEVDESDKPSPEESEPPEDLDEEIRVAKEKRLVEIQEKLSEKIAAMGEQVDDLRGYLSDEDSKLLEKALEREMKELGNIMDKVGRGEYDDAIDELVVTDFEIEDDVDEMEDKEAANTLRMVERLQSQAQRTEERKKRKAEEGEDTSEEDDALETVNELLDKIKSEFKDKVEKSRKQAKNDHSGGKSDNKGKG